MAGIFSSRNERDRADFWREYEERYNEKILAYTLGQYISGWDDYPEPLWGLVIASSGGFRFHHFPHEGWIRALSRTATGGEAPKEKTIFIPSNQILRIELQIQTSWWKKLLFARPPVLAIRYRKAGTEQEGELIIETEKQAEAVVRSLAATPLPPPK